MQANRRSKAGLAPYPVQLCPHALPRVFQSIPEQLEKLSTQITTIRPEGWVLLHLKAGIIAACSRQLTTFLKGNAPVPSWTLVCLVNFSETIPCCYLLSAALPFSRDHIGIGQFMSTRVYSHIRFHAINEHLLLFQQNFVWPIFLFLCSPAPWHTPSQQLLHR